MQSALSPWVKPPRARADWPECFLKARCSSCGRMTVAALRMLLRSHGRVPLLTLADRLRCQECGAKAAPVYLCAGRTRSFLGGPKADWAIELVAPGKVT